MERIHDPWLPCLFPITADVFRESPYREFLVEEPDMTTVRFIHCSRTRFYQGCLDDVHIGAPHVDPATVSVLIPATSIYPNHLLLIVRLNL